MTVSPPEPQAVDGVLEQAIAARADCVYFLMYGGWSSELRANRWHFARRWARHLPVVLVQPTLRAAPSSITTETEPRLENCSILHVLEATEDLSSPRVLVQIAQVAAHLRASGLERPVLWCYNPHLLGVYGGLPGVARVFHATENFADTGMPPAFDRLWTTAISISDLVVSVSSGVSDAVRPYVRGELLESANGCDYRAYAAAEPSRELSAAGSAFSRIAVYAGNVNWRLDLQLAIDAARRRRDVFFALYGPVSLEAGDLARWNELLAEPNVRHFGRVDPDELPSLYHAADVGFIPYKHHSRVVDSGFPLKLLEMGAAGLPVVSTFMKPIVGLADAIFVARSAAEFLEAIGRRDRGRMTPAEREELRRLCQASDHDRRFADVLRALAQLDGDRTPTTRLDAFAGQMIAGADLERWRAELVQLLATRELARPLVYARLASLVPPSLRRAVPSHVRRRIRRVLGA